MSSRNANNNNATPKSKAPRITISRNAVSDTNLTSIFFVINSNVGVQNRTPDQLNELRDSFDDHIMNYLLQSPAAMSKVFGETPLVESLRVERFDWEVGDKVHRLHANLIVTIHHHVKNYSVDKVNQRLREWLNAQEMPPAKGWYVHSFLVDRRAENYANKNKRAEKNNEIEQDEDLEQEFSRLAM